MGKRSPGPMSYIREASALRNIKLCYAGRSFSIRVVIRCLLFKTKKEMVNKPIFSPRPVVKVQVENIKLTIFKGTNPSLAAEIVKAVVHYAH